MKILFLFFTAILVPQLAFASNVEALKLAIDEYNYAITVEWDQKDKAFLKIQDEILQKSISQLVESGLTKQDLLAAYPNVNVEKLELEMTKVTLVDATSIREFIQNTQQSYNKGSSWLSDAQVSAIGASIAIILGVILVVRYIGIRQENQRDKKECIGRGGRWAWDGNYCF
jgi:hypothetical protein